MTTYVLEHATRSTSRKGIDALSRMRKRAVQVDSPASSSVATRSPSRLPSCVRGGAGAGGPVRSRQAQRVMSDRVLRVRAQLAAGTYDEAALLDAALDRILDIICSRR